MPRNFLQYWKPAKAKYELGRVEKDEPMNHTAGEQLYKVRPDDVIWIVTVFPPGVLTVIGRLEAGECTDRQTAMARLKTRDLWEANYHVIAKPETQEPLREVSLFDVAEDLRFDSSRDRLKVVDGYVNGGQLQAMRVLTPESVALIEAKWYESEVSDFLEAELQTSVGAGFGSAEMNREVMAAAVFFVTELYETQGWSVKSVESERCGYDLLCVKDSLEENVEVKGIRGTALSFIITSGEVRQARMNPRFVLCAVTSALSNEPQMSRYTGGEFLDKFKLEELSYKASLIK